MCERPTLLPNGEEVGCRKCKQCLQRKVNDWVGRNIAESKVSDGSYALTLTYGRNEANEIIHNRTVALTYSDFQKYMKKLRTDGYDVRYFVTGEYGEKNGRAHWHPLLYFKGKQPYYENRNPYFMESHWDHGFSFWDDKPGYSAARYACKYILKNMNEPGAQTFGPMPSKKPPLGAEWFRQYAESYVEEGLAPQDLEYSFPEVRFTKRDGVEERVRFWLPSSGATAKLFLDHFIAKWREAYPRRHIPNSELIEEYLDKTCGFDPDLYRIDLESRERAKRPKSFRWMDLDDFGKRWIGDAKNVEEKQRREEQFELIKFADAADYAKYYPKCIEWREQNKQIDWNHVEQLHWEGQQLSSED